MRLGSKILICYFFSLGALSAVFGQKPTPSQLREQLRRETNEVKRMKLDSAISMGYLALKNKDSTLCFLDSTLALAKQLGDLQMQIFALNNKAEIYVRNGQYPEAIANAIPAVRLEEECRDTRRIIFSKRQILWSYEAIGDYRNALAQGLELDSLINAGYFTDTTHLLLYRIITYNNIGEVYGYLGLPDSARYFLGRGLALAMPMKDPEGRAVVGGNFAEFYASIGQTDSAFYLFRFTIVNALLAHRSDLVASCQLGLAKLYQKKGETDSALILGNLAYKASTHTVDTARLVDASGLLADLFESRHQFDSAFKYLSISNKLSKVLLSEGKERRVEDIAFGEVRQQAQLALARQAYFTKLKVFGLSGALLALSILAYILFRNNRQKHKARLEIEEAYQKLKKTQAQLVQSEKMASLGELTAGIAHEIQNPLNFVNNFSEVSRELIDEMKEALSKRDDATVKELTKSIDKNMEKIVYHGKRADSIVKSMLQHSRTTTGQKEPTDLNALADEFLRLSYHGLRASNKSFNATIHTDLDPHLLPVPVISQEIGRVLLNLFNNAFYAINERKEKEGGGYQPSIWLKTRGAANAVEITVRDNGGGIPPSVTEKIFQPFFTTKPAGAGTGLGLSLSYDIIKAHGGSISVQTEEGSGTTFVITLS